MHLILTKNLKVFALGSFALVVYFLYRFMPLEYDFKEENYYLTQGDYLLFSPSCSIINLNPWNVDAKTYYVKRDYFSCLQGQKILSHLVLDINQIDVYLELDPTIDKDIKCCVSNVTRTMISSTNYNEKSVQHGPCKHFRTTKILVSNEEPTYIKCKNSFGTVYENLHQPMALTKTIQKKLSTSQKASQPLSVLILGLDSISRLNMMRTMPHTYKYLQNNDDWLEYKIFQKMGDNTFPNLMAMLTGMNISQAIATCKPYTQSGLDACPFIWNSFSDQGYVTAYAEDFSEVSSFNYMKKGFDKAPTDYYMRAYNLGCYKLLKITYVDSAPYCTGLVSEGERVWDVVRDFTRLHKNNPYFGFFWTNAFGHEDVNTPGRMDDKVRDYLIDIIDTIEENTVVIFLSDHGIRFGPIRNTLTGYVEERLPFLFMRFPKWFQLKYSDYYINLRGNTNKMVTPYDLHMTLQDVLAIGNPSIDTSQKKAALGCPNCQSLFESIDLNRSCQDANITEEWCACSSLVPISNESQLVKEAIHVVLTKLNAMVLALDEGNVCAEFSLHNILNVFQSTNSYGGKADLIVIEFQTNPMATFEASINSRNMEMYGGFSRGDSYKFSSSCMNNSALKMFCYCKEIMEKDRNVNETSLDVF